MKENAMIQTNFRSAAVAVIAVGAAAVSFAAPAFAQNTAAVPAGARVVSASPVVEAEPAVVPPNAFGPFTCAFNEQHTRLERENCGGSHYRSGF